MTKTKRYYGADAPLSTGPHPDPVAEVMWMTDPGRRPWVENSLRNRSIELRSAASRCRIAFNKDYMGAPSKWLADVYDRAADVVDAAFAEIAATAAS